MDFVSSSERPATARAVVARQYDARPLSGRPATAQLSVSASPRSGSAEWRLHTPRTPTATRPAGPRTMRAPRCEASSTATAITPLGEVPGQPELSELLAELRRAPMASEIPPRWRIFEAAKPTRGGAAGQKQLVGEEGVVPGQPSQLRFPGASAGAGAPEQAAYLAYAIHHAKREAHAESAEGFELSGASRGMGPGAPQRQSMAQAEAMVGSTPRTQALALVLTLTLALTLALALA